MTRPGYTKYRQPEGEGIKLIALERQRHRIEKGWTDEHDDTHVGGELVKAATSYIMANSGCRRVSPTGWPWEIKSADTTIGNLVKAGALIAAEIDRLKRQEQQNAK